MTRSSLLFSLVTTVLAGLGIGIALADNFEPPSLNCTTLNCHALALPGRINGHPGVDGAIATTWVGQFAGRPGYCLRLQIASPANTMALSVVAPNGTVYRKSTLSPAVVIANSVNGFYTLAAGAKNGLSSETGFVLRAGLYAPATNINCLGPTVGK